MTLKSKLLLGFFAVLLLTALVGYWGYRGMTTVIEQNNIGDAISYGSNSLLTAQTAQMQYFLSGDKAHMEEAKKALEQSKAHFTRGLQSMQANHPQKAEVGKLLQYADTMLQTRAALLQITETLAKVDDDYSKQGSKVVQTLNNVVKNAYAFLQEGLTTQSSQVVKLITDARAVLYEVRLSTWPLATVPTQKNYETVLSGIARLRTVLQDVEKHLTLDSNKALMRQLMTEIDRYEDFVKESGPMTMKRQKMVQDSDALAQEAVAHAEKLTRSISNAATAQQKQTTLQLMSVLALAIATGLGLAYYITRNVLLQLGRDPGVLVGMARRVSNGDYDIDDGKARMGVYADFVNMVDALRKNISMAEQESVRAREATEEARLAADEAERAKEEAQNARREGMLTAAEKLDAVVEVVFSASRQLSSQIGRSEQGAEEQAARVSETATAMEEMNSTVLEVARNASSAAEVSATTRQKAESGARVVQQAVQGILQVQQQSVQLKNDMQTLDENAKNISQIMGVISDIADQTNLLALNAAIEAARAGDAGRGFAVVADEVRKLAEKTMQSTTDVGNAIKAIQSSASQSMQQVDASVQTIEHATELANQSGEALKEIVALVENTADQVRAIATASEQQSASSEEINVSINQVREIAEETTHVMAEAAQAVTELSGQADVLSSLIAEMKHS